MLIEPSSARTQIITNSIFGFLTEDRERITHKNALTVTNKLNIATLKATHAVGDTVKKIIHFDGETTPIQSEILRRASHLYVERRLHEACAQDKAGIGDVNKSIISNFKLLTDPGIDDGVDLLSEELSENSRLKKIKTEGVAFHIIEAVANFIYFLYSDPRLKAKFDSKMKKDAKTKKNINRLGDVVDGQFRQFDLNGVIDLPEVVRSAEALFDYAGDYIYPVAENEVNIDGLALQRAFIPRKGTLAQGIQHVLAQGSASYIAPLPVEADDIESALAAPEHSAKDLELPDYETTLISNLAQAITATSSILFYDDLTKNEKTELNLSQLGDNLNPRNPKGRENLIKLILAVGLIIVACGPAAGIATVMPTSDTDSTISFDSPMIDNSVPPEIALLMSFAGRTNIDIIGALPLDPAQREILYEQLTGNLESWLLGVPQNQINIDRSLRVGLTHCSDTRVILCTPSMIDGASLIPEGVIIDKAAIGTQPMIFDADQSFFVTHGACIDNMSGCGALGGIKAILENPQYGRQYLIDQGISELTIGQLDDLIRQGATADPVQWALTGARAQAEMNLAANGTNHVVAAAYTSVGDGSFYVIGVVDALHPDQVFSIDDFPLLKGYEAYFNNPHAVDAALVAGQAPKFNVLNSSKFSTSAILGEAAAEPGVPFRVAKKGVNLTYADAVNMVGGFDFSAAHLTQRGNVLTLIADNPEDMKILRAALLNEGVKNGTVAQFLEKGGAIMEMTVDDTGRFGSITIRKAEELGVELKQLDLMKDGLIQTSTRLDFLELAMKSKIGSKLSDKQIVRLAKFYEISKPLLPVLKGVAQGAGDFYTIYDAAKFVDEKVAGRELLHEYYPSEDNIIRSQDYHLLVPDEYRALKDIAPDSDPYVTSGLVEGISIDQGNIAEAYLFAWFAYYERGPGGKLESEPWSNIPSISDLGVPLIIDVPVETQSAGPGDFVHSPIRLFTSLLIKPAYQIFTDESGKEVARYPAYDPQKIYDKTEPMMLFDDVTGFSTSFNPDDGPIQFIAFDKANNVLYLMEAIPDPITNTFQFKFIAPLGPPPTN